MHFTPGTLVMVIRAYPCCGSTPTHMGCPGTVVIPSAQILRLAHRLKYAHRRCGNTPNPAEMVWVAFGSRPYIYHYTQLLKIDPPAEGEIAKKEVTTHEPETCR